MMPDTTLNNVGLPLVVTQAGREAAIAASAANLQLKLKSIALGDGLWKPDGSATGLKNEIKRLDNLGGANVAKDRLHLTVTDDTTDHYSLGEFGLYTESGVLFAIYSQDRPISEKIAESILMVSADIKLDTVPPGSVTIEGNNFRYPPATETVMGVSKIATQQEVDDGKNAQGMVTPKTLTSSSAIKKACDKGDAALAEAQKKLPLAGKADQQVSVQAGTQPDQAVNKGQLDDSLNTLVLFVFGMIIMWSGSPGAVPEGWQLCNGQGKTNNGITIPDLRDRFIVGAGSTYNVGGNGGSASATTSSDGRHSHPIIVGNTTLSAAQMARHSHWQMNTGYDWDTSQSVGVYSVGGDRGDINKRCVSNTNTQDTGKSGTHGHSAKSTSAGSHSHTVKTLPPYYALAFIIKL